MKKYFPTIAKTALVLVYLVIVAGALVRMTGSGMGCPDWPKCFGYYIPPTDLKELTWEPNRAFEKGQVIIKDESLLVAKDNFTTETSFDASHWEKYTKHDYALFNPLHTWIEYINRLCGALAGMACFFMAIASFKFWKQNKKITLLSWLVVFMMGFQAWLGAKVVYSVLNPIKITVHMVMALVIVAVILYIIQLARPKLATVKYNSTFRNVLLFSLLLTLVQVAIGTQVRQFVDEQVKNGLTASIVWLQNPSITFYVHRSFSILVLLVNLYLYVRNTKFGLGFSKINWVVAIIGIEILTGMAMAYLDFPIGSQAIHLVLASILFGIQFYMILEAKKPSPANS
ncbi:cytochrome c oxidase assembly protein subunit 15 [Flavobacterium aquidurense]|uniref:Heme A synthase n=1 Tax=Flavobacterium frigidimaris TaxID=262320 RepID=A0ABX4BNV8_FLAFR|nr:COX15/CtaA family protein [Flavobacterium frigidimaris]OXA77713.1 heme A synthase [Flavobacterium frigidimaris]SDY86614.1 cytochrome c oxidase assembly protein subunit 15 [Flavobacterium aquidurense]